MLLKYRWPHKKYFHYRIAPHKSLPSADNLRVKIRPALAASSGADYR